MLKRLSIIIFHHEQAFNSKARPIVSLLVEGMAINAIVRATGFAKNTVLKLLADLGNACAVYQYNTFRNLNCKRLELDEIWSFCFSKQKNVPADKQGVFGYGDLYLGCD